MRKLVDTTRLFDAKGRPLSSYEAMEKRIKLLEYQLARVLRLLRGQKLKAGIEQAEDHRTLN
jgi:hypothetical protein